MKIVSFNVNSIRARIHQLAAVVEKHQPDVIGLQETKVIDEEFPVDEIEALGYQVLFHGQKTHYGVALLTRTKPNWIEKGFAEEEVDEQRRFVGCGLNCKTTGKEIAIFNGYFPQGESRDHPKKFPAKLRFYQKVTERISQAVEAKSPVVLMGDMNVAPSDVDIGIGESNAKRWLSSGKCSFLPEEREWLDELLALNLKDSFRELSGESALTENQEIYSWFDYRSRGFERDPKRGLRIDLILTSPELLTEKASAGIDYDIRAMEKPSDHCPVWMEY